LQIKNRKTFKRATLSDNINLQDTQCYLREAVSEYQPVRTLLSASNQLLTVNVAEVVLDILVILEISAVAVWNSLPDTIRNSSDIDIFKRKIKA